MLRLLAPKKFLWRYPLRNGATCGGITLIEKTTVIICWVVVTAMWLAQTFVLLIVLICMYSSQVKFISWLLSFIFGIFATLILLYIVLIGCGLWLELKQKQLDANTDDVHT
ncbi:unnamed protein product [Pieris brassicae]|uniref:Uncharacterized protein n=1 Tax=Pieris brassicae TaxID=7116 RepID=A0A9P0TGC9_PIEBR|nr:unnamed protein product [Pieris brassicae]